MKRRLATSFAALWLAFLFVTTSANASVEFSFPLGPHYRVGRYIPVHVVARGEGSAVRVELPGTVPTEISTQDGNVDAIVPLLVVASIDGPRTTDMPSQLMRRLEDAERLVGFASPDERLASELFSGNTIVSASLNLAEPLPGPATAWGSLDAVILDEAAAARVSDGQLQGLRAAGTAVAIRTDTRPVGEWQWERRGAWWVLPPDERAAVRLVQPARYAIPGDAVGAPSDFRRVILLSLACFAIAVVAASLWHDRRAWRVIISLSVFAAVGIAWWNAGQDTTAVVMTSQTVNGPWVDRYMQYVARADGEVRHWIVDTDAAAWPIAFSPRHARDVDVTLESRPDGPLEEFVVKLKRGQSIVFLNRSLTPAPAPATAPAAPPR